MICKNTHFSETNKIPYCPPCKILPLLHPTPQKPPCVLTADDELLHK
jgi:hypothetical protein